MTVRVTFNGEEVASIWVDYIRFEEWSSEDCKECDDGDEVVVHGPMPVDGGTYYKDLHQWDSDRIIWGHSDDHPNLATFDWVTKNGNLEFVLRDNDRKIVLLTVIPLRYVCGIHASCNKPPPPPEKPEITINKLSTKEKRRGK